MTEELVVVREPADEPVVEFVAPLGLYRLKDQGIEISSGDPDEWGKSLHHDLARAILRADRIRRGEEPPADGFELKQKQGEVTKICRQSGATLWIRRTDGVTWLNPNCTTREIIAIGDILKGEKRD